MSRRKTRSVELSNGNDHEERMVTTSHMNLRLQLQQRIQRLLDQYAPKERKKPRRWVTHLCDNLRFALFQLQGCASTDSVIAVLLDTKGKAHQLGLDAQKAAAEYPESSKPLNTKSESANGYKRTNGNGDGNNDKETQTPLVRWDRKWRIDRRAALEGDDRILTGPVDRKHPEFFGVLRHDRDLAYDLADVKLFDAETERV